MIFPEKWGEQWVGAWNRRDLDGLLAMYAEDIQLRSPFAKVYARDGVIRGKNELREYWGEAMRRMPNMKLEFVAVYAGHMAMALHYRDDAGRNVIESVMFNEQDKAIFETACLDRLR